MDILVITHRHQMDRLMGLSWTVRRLDSQPVQISESVERVGIKFRVPIQDQGTE